jgi:RHS repeat-associated protein
MSLKNLLLKVLLASIGLLCAGEALAARTTTYYHNDGLGSVVAATNDAGTVLWRKDYAPFGEQIDETPETERTAYTGKQHDTDTGLTDFGARQFDPEIGRFLNIDPTAFVESNTMSFNRYLYVNNNPYKYVDPDGEFLNFAAKFVLDVGLSVAVNYYTTGELNVAGALRDSAISVFVPAATLAKAGKLMAALSKVSKVSPDASVAQSGFSHAVQRVAKTGRGGESAAAAAGRRAHNNYGTALGANFDTKVRLPSGKKPDAVDWGKREVRELKPDNAPAVARGQKQVEGYKKELEQVTGQKWTSVVDVYRAGK